jgi:TonB-linked SusC/RagA family outer membrane protein
MNVSQFFQRALRAVLVPALVSASLWGPSRVNAQQATATGAITGHVVDAGSKAPVASAQIQIVGTTRGIVAGDDGRFRINNVPAGTYQVRVLRIGFQAQVRTVTVTAGEAANADFELKPTVVNLDQVVTTATGASERKREQGNAVGTVVPAPTQLAAAQTPSQLLTGRIPGVDVATSGGTVGSGSRIRIRGANSLSLSNEPIIVVDGVRFNNAVGQDATSGATTIGVGGQVPSRFNDINPEDIERVDILKGPAAAALYGTAAASGVIQITTKRGRNSAPRWNLFVEGGSIRDVTSYPANYAQIGTTTAGKRTTACTLDSQTRGLCTPFKDSLMSLNPLEKYSPFINGHRGAYGASVLGGSDAVNYYLAGNYDRQQGVFTASTDQRGSGRANLTAQLRPTWNVQVSTSYLADHIRLPQNDNNTLGIVSTGLLGSAFDDSVPGKPCSGGPSFNPTLCGHGYLSGIVPSMTQNGMITRQDVQRFENSINTNFQPLSWLTATGVAGLDYLNRYDNETVLPNTVAFGSLPQGQRTSNPYQIYNYTATGSLSAVWSVTEDLKATSTGSIQFNKELVRGTRAFGANMLAGTQSLSGTAARFAVGETNTDNKTLGELFREELAWRDRLYLTGGLRNDKNSAFGVNFGSIVYPSVQGSWVVSDESFFPKSSILSSLRLRAADGQSGRQPNFRDAITYYNAQTVTVGGTDVPGITSTGAGTGNPNLRPERSTEVEFGGDLGFFNNRLSAEITHYHKKTTDLLVAVPLPPSLGLTTTQFQNLGAMLNTGWETSWNAKVLDRSNVALNVLFTTTTNNNKVITLGVLPNDSILKSIVVNTQQQHRPGYPAGGYWQRAITYNDANHDGIISRSEVTLTDTAVYLGNPLPKRQWSISPDLTLLKYFRVSALFDHKGGYKLFNNTARFRCSFGNCRAASDPTAPLAQQAAAIAIPLGTDAGYIENADFTKLRELSFTLMAPASFTRAFGGHDMNLIIAGRNLHTWTKYSGFDPEVNSSPGANFTTQDFLTLPPSRTWTARVNVTF